MSENAGFLLGVKRTLPKIAIPCVTGEEGSGQLRMEVGNSLACPLQEGAIFGKRSEPTRVGVFTYNLVESTQPYPIVTLVPLGGSARPTTRSVQAAQPT